ncbi:MAG: glycosyltransferase family 4 protein [Leptolyngbyaceae cyanobacterium bins.302]|nr:glycosyltransferase family 4 protein [Leptolyngbyaceae cyanobacterium bins.302]
MIANPISQSTSVNKCTVHSRIAWLLQDAGAYWQPILSEFAQLFAHTKVFTAVWAGFLPEFEDSFCVEQVGTIKVLSTTERTKGYAPSVTYLSPQIVPSLLAYKPDVVFTTAFSIWTTLAVLFKWFGQWRVVIVYDGSSPGVDHRGKSLRSLMRKELTRWTDGFITNSDAGRQYLIDELGVSHDRVVVRPYLVPHPKTYESSCSETTLDDLQLRHPIFMFAGYHIPRKGLQELLNACVSLNQQGYRDYSLLILGDGPQRSELEAFAGTQDLASQLHWVGSVPYEQVGAYFQKADVFVFPTLEDVWGLVAVEAMLFGKPILCSKWAGTVELVAEGKNGFVFDPHQPEQLAELMIQLIENPELISLMGEQSRLVMAEHTPDQVAQTLAEVVELVLCK